MAMPSRPILIAPSLLAADFSRLGDEVRAIEAAGADVLHVDVMDGHFVPTITLGPQMVQALRPHSSLPIDVHLMITPVEPQIEAFAKAGADLISFHPEAGPHAHRSVQMIKSFGKKAGMVLNPGTPISAIEELLPDLDLVLVMSVNPGYGGQAFIPSTLSKVKALRAMIDKLGKPIALEIDGGINFETAPQAIAAGADWLVAGTATFKGGPAAYADNIRRLRGS